MSDDEIDEIRVLKTRMVVTARFVREKRARIEAMRAEIAEAEADLQRWHVKLWELQGGRTTEDADGK